MTGLHESTAAWSAYNAIAVHGVMNGEQLLAVLRRVWDPRCDFCEVQAGVNYLLARGLVTLADGIVAPSRLENGAARTVVRDPLRKTELIWGRGEARKSMAQERRLA